MRAGPGASPLRAGCFLVVLLFEAALTGGARFELSSNPVLEFVEDWVNCDAVKLS